MVRRLPTWLLPALAAALVAFFDRRLELGDLSFFARSGRQLFSGGAFADEHVQSGPIQLALAGGGSKLASLLGIPFSALAAFAIEVGLAIALMLVVRRLAGQRAQLATGLAAVALGLTHWAFAYEHPAEVAIPLLWIVAGLEARRGRSALAGTLVALSAGLELWGMLGVACLLLAPRTVRAVGAQLAVATLLFAPFVLAGRFHMLDYRWHVSPAPGTPFGWPLRLAQGALALAAAALVARCLRRSPHAVWAIPVTIVVARIALDPIWNPWYWLGLETPALVGAAAFLSTVGLPVLESRRGRALPEVPPAGLL